MRPRLSAFGFASLGLVATAAACAIAPAAHAQSYAATNAAGPNVASTVISNIPATWSTDPSCGAEALRVTFGGNMLAIERNGHVIFRGAARLAISDDEIAVRLGSDPVQPAGAGPDRNTIRFNRAGDAIRLVSVALPVPGAFPRVPPLYPCRPPSAEATGAVMVPASATLPASAR